MHYYVGTFYPGRSVVLPAYGVRGYELSRASLRTIAALLPGCALTVEHMGIATAVASMSDVRSKTGVLRALNGVAAAAKEKCPIGLVTGAWEAHDGSWMVAFALDGARFPRVAALIRHGVLGSLSLTHYHPDGGDTGVVPLEMSLCHEPARPSCAVLAGPFDHPSGPRLYKALSVHPCTRPAMESATPATPATTTTTSADQMVSALKNLDPSQRNVISAALASFDTKLSAATAEATRYREENEAITKATAVDQALLASELERFIAAVGTERAGQFGIKDVGTCARNLESPNAAVVRRQVDRLLTCCNAAMIKRDAARAASPSGPAPPPPPEPVVNERKRKADDGELADDPGRELRAALNLLG